MKEARFPKTLAAVERANGNDQWAIGDALVKEVGKPSASGSRDSSSDRFAECALELQDRGFAYTANTLRKFRDTAHAFPGARRRAAIPFETHKEAGNPDILARAFRLAPKNKRTGKKVVTKRFAASVSKAVREEERLKREAEKEAQRAAAERKEQEAKEARERAEQEGTEEAREEATQKEREAEAAQLPPEPGPPASDEEIDARLLREKILGIAEDAAAGVDEAKKLLEEHEGKFDAETLELIADTFRETGNKWMALAAHYTNRRSSLAAVGVEAS